MRDRPQQTVVRGLGDPSPYLLPEERVVVGVRRHVLVLAPALLETLGFVAGAFMIQLLISYVQVVETATLLIAVAALVRFCYLVLEWRMERFVITDQRMMLVSGVVTRQVAVMPIRKVTDLTFEKTLFGQLLGYGTFVVESAGQDQAMSRVEFLPHANRLYLKVSDLLFGRARPSIDPDLVTDPPLVAPEHGADEHPGAAYEADGAAAPEYDLDRTDPYLGAQLGGLDLRPHADDGYRTPSDEPAYAAAPAYREDGSPTDQFAVPGPTPLGGLVEHPHGSGPRLRERLGGLNGRGRRREGPGGPITEHTRR
ncbi:PH domain-containing protein [Cumulibacter manganitolerans]|uniref:PH domain-containing protein n=1 Tax=Cumulibacter manganitolerans TaxID=1884992 RepID=UPI00188625D1|nr:PH domain-containing protein [Cumulibacter manganitolerans]